MKTPGSSQKAVHHDASQTGSRWEARRGPTGRDARPELRILQRRANRWSLGVAALVILMAVAWNASARAKSGEGPQSTQESPVAPALARDRARMMQKIYQATLTVMHDRYFHSNRAVLPARAMEDVFLDVAEATGADARWIAVNTKAMSVDHQPQTDFEKQAAKALDAGQAEYEEESEGVYRYAVAVPLGSGCIGCHTGFTGAAPQSPKVAGLVLSIPVNEE